MGVSTDGILFYGFLIDEDSGNWDLLTKGPNPDEESDEEYDQDDLWRKAFNLKDNTVWKFQDKHPVTIGTHCSSECPEYYVAMKKSETTARRGYPEEIKNLDIDPKWDEQLKEFCEKMGFMRPKKFGWYLVSYWS